jgi:hypothetical protein
MKIIESINPASYDHFAWVRKDETCDGPFRLRIQAIHAQQNGGGGGYLIPCTSIGVLQPEKLPNGKYLDLGTIKEPTFPTYISSISADLPVAQDTDSMGIQPKVEELTVDEIEEILAPTENTQTTENPITYTREAETGKQTAVSMERQQRQAEHLRMFGFSLPPLPYAPGSVMDMDTAGKHFQIKRQNFDELSPIVNALESVRTRVCDERRVDVLVQPSMLRMLDDGSIYRENGKRSSTGAPSTLIMEENGLRQLCTRLPDFFPRAADFLLAMEPADRAKAFNAQARRIPAENKLLLRTRQQETEKRTVFSTVGAKYSSFDANMIAETLIPAFEGVSYGNMGETRGTALYIPADSSLQVNALWQADTVVDAAVGDVFKVGLRFSSSDTGGGSIKGSLVVWRNACLNFVVLARTEVEIMRRVHRGSMDSIVVDLRSAASKAEIFLDAFAQDWGLLRKTDVNKIKLWGETYKSVPDALKALVEQGRIDGTTANAVGLEALLTSWKQEPGNSLADLINAVSRYAHTEKVTIDRQQKLEHAAGELIPVLVRSVYQSRH